MISRSAPPRRWGGISESPWNKPIVLTANATLRTIISSMRTIPALLLIAALLACPFRCLGSFGVSCAQGEEVSGCRCCQHHKPKPDTSAVVDNQGPSDSEESCNCGGCLCHGAVRGNDGSIQDHLAFIAEMPDASLIVVLPKIESQPGEWAERPPIPTLAVGRSLRLALHSLQV